jgi:hypothetical protein
MASAEDPPGAGNFRASWSRCWHVSYLDFQSHKLQQWSKKIWLEQKNYIIVAKQFSPKFLKCFYEAKKKTPIFWLTVGLVGDLTGYLAGDLVANKLYYCSKIEIDRDLAGDIIAKNL